MTQVCEAAQLCARRMSAEEFCLLARREAGSIYRPRSEVLRMLTVGQAWGVCGLRGAPETALLALPLSADLGLAAALRELLGPRQWGGGWILTPPVGQRSEALTPLLEGVLAWAARRSRGGELWAVLECTPDAEELMNLYLEQGLALRAIRPLNSLAPCYLFAPAPAAARPDPVWVPLADRSRLALLLNQGWAALESRLTPQGPALGLSRV